MSPVGTAATDTERKDLESCPPDGYVVLRKLTYGEDLKIRGISTRMHMKRQEIENARRNRGDDDGEIEMSIDIDAVTAFQFRCAIVEHNITDSNGKRLNFSNRADFTKLDPKVGEEIERYITEMNPRENLRDTAEKGGTTDTGDGPLASDSGGLSAAT